MQYIKYYMIFYCFVCIATEILSIRICLTRSIYWKSSQQFTVITMFTFQFEIEGIFAFKFKLLTKSQFNNSQFGMKKYNISVFLFQLLQFVIRLLYTSLFLFSYSNYDVILKGKIQLLA